MNHNGIKSAAGEKVLLIKNGNTDDIIDALLDEIPGVKEQTREFSRQFSPDREGLRRLWTWVKRNIRYVEDPLGVQWIRTPARLWYDREGDCKSFTLFIVSVLENLKMPYYVRFTNTEKPGGRIVNHVYPIAVLNGKEIVLDAVWRAFDTEHKFFFKKDYDMAEIYRLSGIGNTADLEALAIELTAAVADIPDSILLNDITRMTAGDFFRYQQAALFSAQSAAATNDVDKLRYEAAAASLRRGKIVDNGAAMVVSAINGQRSGVGSLDADDIKVVKHILSVAASDTTPAFPVPLLRIPEEGVSGVGDKIKDAAESILNAWRKMVNWLFKTGLKEAAPFFLYTFIKKPLPEKSNRRRARQEAILAFIEKAGKFDSKDAVRNAIRLAIVEKTGKQPEAYMQAQTGEKISGDAAVGVIPVAAIAAVVEILSKVATLFKKSSPGASAADAPDFTELKYDLAMANNANKQPGLPQYAASAPQAIMENLPLLLLIGGAVYVLNRK